MELKTAIGYLLALAVPLWLLAEQVIYWGRSAKRASKQVEPSRLLGKLASHRPARVMRAPAMRLGHPRKTG